MSQSKIGRRLRQQVYRRAQGVCEYCRNQESLILASFEADHIIPQARGGRTHATNLALACPLCNDAKYTKLTGYDVETESIVPLFNPRLQIWGEHFKWSYDCGEIVGMTPCGRATVQALNMNRPRVIIMRLRWRALELHPP